jgi:hypothetical protein
MYPANDSGEVHPELAMDLDFRPVWGPAWGGVWVPRIGMVGVARALPWLMSGPNAPVIATPHLYTK